MSLSPSPSSLVHMPSPHGLSASALYGSDDSSIIELSFEYDYDNDGNFIRIAKGSSKSPQSTPPTPPDQHILGDDSLAPRIPSVIASSFQAEPPRRLSLSRSESLPAETSANARTLQRAVSDFVPSSVTPAQPSRGLTQLSSAVKSTGHKVGGPQRVTMQEAREIEERIRREEEAEREQLRKEKAEKENKVNFNRQHSPPSNHIRVSASLPSHQITSGFPRPTSSIGGMKNIPGSAKFHEFDRNELEEIDASRLGQADGHQWQLLSYQNHSAVQKQSPSDGAMNVAYDADLNLIGNVQPRYIPLPISRPSSSMGATGRPRRVTYEEKLRQERDIALRTERARDIEDFVENDFQQGDKDEQPQSVSPTIGSSLQYSRQTYSHHRQSSDTLRTASSQPHIAPLSDQDFEPRHIVIPSRQSPTNRSASIQSSISTSASTTLVSRHRRSPTAPQPSTTSATLVPNGYSAEPIGKTWAGGEDGRKPRDSKDADDHEGQHIKTSSTNKQTQIHQQSGPDIKSRSLIVNKKVYARLDMIGKGGSSRVFRVMNSANEIYAIKRVALDKTDDETLAGYMNEIALLKRLEGNSRIIRLLDSEVRAGAGSSKGHLMLVMECGEIDLARLLQEQQKEPMNMVWISYYWQQVLQAVQVIHDEKIVHSDLKPANFVLVKGQLKLIDFGIANAIANDTTNIQRDHQIGTINYMSPEAIELPDGMRRLKVGRPSDVWSLGCILYQMVYGHPPFHHLNMIQKMKAIPDHNHIIDFPDHAIPSVPAARNSQGVPLPPKKLEHLARPVHDDVRKSMQKCLKRSAKERSTIPELLDEDWLGMKQTVLKEDETIINPHYMRQLLQYAIRCAQEGRYDLTEEEEMKEAERLVQELKSISSP